MAEFCGKNWALPLILTRDRLSKALVHPFVRTRIESGGVAKGLSWGLTFIQTGHNHVKNWPFVSAKTGFNPFVHGAGSVKSIRSAVFIFFAAYCVVQYAGKVQSPKGEYFPVFSWSLFSSVRDTYTDFTVEISRIGDQRFDPPVNYYDLPKVFPRAATRDTAVGKAAFQLATLGHSGSQYDARESAFIGTFFPVAEAVDFQIVAVTYNPIKRWRTGEIIEKQVLSEHVKASGS